MGCPSGQHQCGTTQSGGAICCPNPYEGGVELAEHYEPVRKKGSKKMKRKNRIARRKARAAAKTGASYPMTHPTKFRNASHQARVSDLHRAIQSEKSFRSRTGCGAACGY